MKVEDPFRVEKLEFDKGESSKGSAKNAKENHPELVNRAIKKLGGSEERKIQKQGFTHLF